MTNSEILERAITKAIEGGWICIDLPDQVSFRPKKPIHIDEWPWYLVRFFNDLGQEVEVNVEHILFDKEFAKALWGDVHDCGAGYHKKRKAMRLPNLRSEGYTEHEINLDYVTYCLHNTKNWQHHLQNMVIAENPIQYLGEHLDG